MKIPAFDGGALRRGITVAGVVGIVVTLLSWSFDHGAGDRGPTGLFTIVVLFGFLLGGFAAATQQRVNAPLSHSLVAVMSVVVGLQVVRIVRLSALHRPLNLPASLGNLLLGLLAAVLGGLLAGQKPTKPELGK